LLLCELIRPHLEGITPAPQVQALEAEAERRA